MLTSLAWALFCSGLASGSKVKAATPAALLSSSIFFWASSADTELSGFWAASMAPCCLSSDAACSVAMLSRQHGYEMQQRKRDSIDTRGANAGEACGWYGLPSAERLARRQGLAVLSVSSLPGEIVTRGGKMSQRDDDTRGQEE